MASRGKKRLLKVDEEDCGNGEMNPEAVVNDGLPSDDAITAYERRPRKQRAWLEEARGATQLPIITAEGEVVYRGSNGRASNNREKEEEKEQEGEEGVPVSKKKRRRLEAAVKEEKEKRQKKIAVQQYEARTPQGKAAAEADVIVRKLRTSTERLMEIAHTASLVMADPESDLGRLEVLLRVYDHPGTGSEGQWVKTLALVSLGAVMKDVIPGYKITEDLHEKKPQAGGRLLSKAVEKLQKNEKLLLYFHSRVLSILDVNIRSQSVLLPQSVAVACELLQASPRFNNHDRLITLCVKNAENRTPMGPKSNVTVGEKCQEALGFVMDADVDLEAAVVVAKCLAELARSQMVDASEKTKEEGPRRKKRRKLEISGGLLRLMTKLDFEKKENAARREMKARGLAAIGGSGELSEELQRDIRLSTVHGDLKKLQSNFTTLTREMFVVYLRILRSHQTCPIDVLESAVAALGSSSRSVNVELVTEVIEELRDLMEHAIENHKAEAVGRRTEDDEGEADEGEVSPSVGLLAISSALEILSGVGASLNVNASWIGDALASVLRSLTPFLAVGSISPSCTTHHVKFTRGFATCLERKDGIATTTSIATSGEAACAALHCVSRFMKCPAAFGGGWQAVRSGHGKTTVLAVLKELAALAAVADVYVGFGILNTMLSIIKEVPGLSSAVEPEGVVISSLSPSESLYWSLELLATCSTPHPTILRWRQIVESGVEDLMKERLSSLPVERRDRTPSSLYAYDSSASLVAGDFVDIAEASGHALERTMGPAVWFFKDVPKVKFDVPNVKRRALRIDIEDLKNKRRGFLLV